MAAKTLLAFPAALAEPEPAIDVDVSAFEELPTEPFLPPPERPTGRPSSTSLASLVEATRTSPAWLGEPLWVFEPTTGALVLKEPYKGRQVDEDGNVFSVECPSGIQLDPPATREQARKLRTELIRAALRQAKHAWVVPPLSGVELLIVLDDQWRDKIAAAFLGGDVGRLARG